MNTYWTIYFMNNTQTCPTWLWVVVLGLATVVLISALVWVIKETWIW